MIFITQNDVMKGDLPLYHVERVVKEQNRDFGDGSHIIYVNDAYKNDEQSYGLGNTSFVPRIPGRINQKKG